MVAVVLLGLGWLCAPLGALVLDFNNIKSSADAQGARKGSQCLSDKDCSTRKFCLRPQDEKPFCATCRGLRRRCQRDAMCCPGSLCVNDVCTAMEDATLILERQTDDQDDLDTKGTTGHPTRENKPKRKLNIKNSQDSKETHREHVLFLISFHKQLRGSRGQQYKDRREEAASEHPTADLGFAVLVIFGLKSASQSCWRDRSAPGEGTKSLPKLQKSSSVVTVVLDCPVEVQGLAPARAHG
ncbi:dickkopf-related protein 4 precursor [Camelus ferus]|nr:dickkopf-related protein 4 precursor [Camelus ferus]